MRTSLAVGGFANGDGDLGQVMDGGEGGVRPGDYRFAFD
jgi:hypothetical protein